MRMYDRYQLPAGMTCGEYYLSPYIEKVGTGYILDKNATSECKMCQISTTSNLTTVSSKYSRRWRNLGIFIAYIVFNYVMAMFLYWWARVPKKANRVSDEKSLVKITKIKRNNCLTHI